MSTNLTSDTPLQPPPASLPSPVDAGDVKPEISAPEESEKIVLRLCDAATKLRKTERFKIHVAQRRVEVGLLRSAKERSQEDLHAHPHVGLGEDGGPEHTAALEAYAAASKTYQKAKKRLGVLNELLGKMESDVITQEYLVKD